MSADIVIKHRFTRAVLWTGEAESIKDAVKQAVSGGANLGGANLGGANLAGANLAGAYLADANLARADLADANLGGANLARAYLADANLADADLADADLAGANIAGANLGGAYLAGARNIDVSGHADPPAPYEREPHRSNAERAADYRARHPEVPVVPNLDGQILALIESGKGALDMSHWHSCSCSTTHCRAGWAIHLAGDAGYALERQLRDPARAGRAIYRASTGRSPHFYATNESALEDIRRCAKEVGA